MFMYECGSVIILTEGKPHQLVEINTFADAIDFFGPDTLNSRAAGMVFVSPIYRPVVALAAPSYDDILDNPVPEELVAWITEPLPLDVQKLKTNPYAHSRQCGLLVLPGANMKQQYKLWQYAEKASVQRVQLLAWLEPPPNPGFSIENL